MKKTIKDYIEFCDKNKLTEKHRMMALNAYKKSCKIEADREKQKKKDGCFCQKINKIPLVSFK